MARASNLASMPVEALLKLRDDIGEALGRRTAELKDQLSRLPAAADFRRRGPRKSLRGRKVAVKYRDRSGNTWAGRGMQPLWLRERLKSGAKIEDFAVDSEMLSRKTTRRKAKKRGRVKKTSAQTRARAA
jgi:DNA-binding protein H-NS